MAQLIVRKLDDAAKERLEARATRNGRSVEAEARAIIEEATENETTRGDRGNNQSFGEFMDATFKDIGLTDDEWRRFNIGVSDMNSESTFPDFEADEYEESTPHK